MVVFNEKECLWSPQPCAKSVMGDTKEVGGPGPRALSSSTDIDAAGPVSDPRLCRFIYEGPGVDLMAYQEGVRRY